MLLCGLLLTTALAAYIWGTGRSNRQLSTQNALTDAAINNMVQGFLMFDAAERIIICNDRYIEMYGLSRDIVKPGCSFLTLLKHRCRYWAVEPGPSSVSRRSYCGAVQGRRRRMERHHRRWARHIHLQQAHARRRLDCHA